MLKLVNIEQPKKQLLVLIGQELHLFENNTSVLTSSCVPKIGYKCRLGQFMLKENELFTGFFKLNDSGQLIQIGKAKSVSQGSIESIGYANYSISGLESKFLRRLKAKIYDFIYNPETELQLDMPSS